MTSAAVQTEIEAPWEASAKQAEFQRAIEFEVLYGGAAGGGKSDALLVDALGLHQGAILKRNYQALLMRRTYPDLKDLIDRSLALYERLPGAKYDKTEHIWRFPSGARIEFGHAQYESDRFKYRGRAFQYFGIDELTLFPTDTVYVYLMSRVRSVDASITCYVRATTNPDGPGSKWVKDRFRIPLEGTATRFEVEYDDPETGAKIRRTRRFIPARLADNPYLADTGYRDTLLMLPEEERNALLLGRWEQHQVKGAYYAEQVQKARAEGRVCKIPILPHLRVHTYWDLGNSDHTSIWFLQKVGGENRWIDCYENRLKPLHHYVEIVQQKNYLLGKFYLPHDAEEIRLSTKTLQKPQGQSISQMLQEMLPNADINIVPRTPDIIAGINQVRNLFPTYYFDEDRCKDGLAAVENYKAGWDEQRQVFSNTPVHDWSSDYADAIRQHAQSEDAGGGTSSGSKFKRNKMRTGWRTA
ncbi:MAG: terminase large subunit domain-containing protein [Sulfuricaulis sp.]